MPEDLEIQVYASNADYDFVDLFGLEIVEGRNFSPDFPSDKEGAFLINETAVRVLKAHGWEQVIGHDVARADGIGLDHESLTGINTQ